MPEYIEREELLKDINETVLFTVRNGVNLPTAEMRGANKVIDQIKSAPTADVVEVRHGEWIETQNEMVCSKCHLPPLTKEVANGTIDILTKHCPNCGAKMDGFHQDLKGESI